MELGSNYMAATDFIMVSEVTSLHLSITPRIRESEKGLGQGDPCGLNTEPSATPALASPLLVHLPADHSVNVWPHRSTSREP